MTMSRKPSPFELRCGDICPPDGPQTLEDARKLILKGSGLAENYGFTIALYGSTLKYGRGNDIDVVAIPFLPGALSRMEIFVDRLCSMWEVKVTNKRKGVCSEAFMLESPELKIDLQITLPVFFQKDRGAVEAMNERIRIKMVEQMADELYPLVLTVYPYQMFEAAFHKWDEAPEIVYKSCSFFTAVLGAYLMAKKTPADEIEKIIGRPLDCSTLKIPEKSPKDELRDKVLKLRNEVNCRIEHGANSYGHLDYVQKELDEILNEKN